MALTSGKPLRMESDRYHGHVSEDRRRQAVRSLVRLERSLRGDLVWWLEQLDATEKEIVAVRNGRVELPDGAEPFEGLVTERTAELRERQARIESQVASRLLWIWRRERRRAALGDPSAL